MALKREHDNVVLTLGHLGDLLRVSLDDDLPQEVSLADELELLDRYLEIQRIRFGDRLTIRHEVDVEALDAMVPVMLLQPLVENAIVHGVAPIPGPGEVVISAERRDGTLVLEIRDTGPGFSDHTDGIGLGNTRARLGQLYGAAHSIALGSTNGKRSGARVTVTIPLRSALARVPQHT